MTFSTSSDFRPGKHNLACGDRSELFHTPGRKTSTGVVVFLYIVELSRSVVFFLNHGNLATYYAVR